MNCIHSLIHYGNTTTVDKVVEFRIDQNNSKFIPTNPINNLLFKNGENAIHDIARKIKIDRNKQLQHRDSYYKKDFLTKIINYLDDVEMVDIKEWTSNENTVFHTLSLRTDNENYSLFLECYYDHLLNSLGECDINALNSDSMSALAIAVTNNTQLRVALFDFISLLVEFFAKFCASPSELRGNL